MRASLAPQPQWRTLWREPSTGEAAQVIAIHFAGVPRHGLGHAEDVGAAGAQEAVPQPHVGAQFGVVPGEAADVVAPHVARAIVLVHHVAVSSRSRTSGAAPLLAGRARRPRRADLRARVLAGVERSGRLQMPKTLAEWRCSGGATSSGGSCAQLRLVRGLRLRGHAARWGTASSRWCAPRRAAC